MKKDISFKMWLTVFFGGIWQFIRNIFSWKNKTPFWRVVWAAITICVIIFTAIFVSVWYNEYLRKSFVYSSEYYDGRVSPHYKYHNNGYNGGSSYIYDAKTGKKIYKGLDWVAVPESGDSLMVIAKDGKRAYINRFTMETVIPFKYDAAWSFYEGVAAVCEGDSIHYIDHTGKPINNIKFLRDKKYGNYAYHGNYAAIPVGDKYGLIDKAGNWVFPPHYDYLSIGRRNLWYISHNGKMGVIGTNGGMIVPCNYKDITINSESGITVTLADNVRQLLDYEGNLIDDFVFEESYFLSYNMDEFDKEGNQKQGVADMLKYSSGYYYGLMTKTGIPVTKPIYTDIQCVIPGVYQCEIPGTGEYIMIDGKGKRIEDKGYE